MISSRILICGLLLVSSVYAGLNEQFLTVLAGQAELTKSHLDQMFSQFLSEYENDIPTTVHRSLGVDRKQMFEAKVREIIQHNSNPSNSYQKGINAYSDMSEQEFMTYFNIPVKADQDCSATNTVSLLKSSEQLKDLPTAWDWRTFNIVSPVKNQKSCGSCWTFSTIGAMESHWLMFAGASNFRNLSEQQLVNCAGNYDNNGCSGGLPSHAFEYIKDNGGLTTETQIPYTAKDDTCQYNNRMASVGTRGGSVNITVDESELQIHLQTVGPVSVAFQVITGFKDYKSGVYKADKCGTGPMDVNHAVLAVGYGTDPTDGDFWIIKNSWSAAWGDQGFFKMARGVNMCGIKNCNSYPADVYDATPISSEFLQ